MDSLEKELKKKSTAKMYTDGSKNQSPPVNITEPKIYVKINKGATALELKSGMGANYKFLTSGYKTVEPGNYKHIAWGTTYKHNPITTVIFYN